MPHMAEHDRIALLAALLLASPNEGAAYATPERAVQSAIKLDEQTREQLAAKHRAEAQAGK